MKSISVLITLFASFTMWGQSAPDAVVPFTIENNVVYIYCKVNSTDSLKFLFDTGADGSVINTGSKIRADIKITGNSLNTGSNGSNAVEQSDNNIVRFGDIVRSAVSLTLIDFQTDTFDGVFGTDLMRGNVIEIDYNSNEIRFYKQDNPAINYARYDKMKLHLVNGYPAIESHMIIDGKKYKGLFGLDSGADDLLTIAAPYAKNNKLKDRMRNIGTATSQGSDGSVYETPIVLCPVIDFSGKYLYNIPVSLSNSTEGIDSTDTMAGFFGNNFLKRFNVIIDFKSELIYFKLNKNLYYDVYH
jgi:hypothetical protein